MTQKVEGLSSYGVRLWAYLETELLKRNAFLLPLRLFIGLGWVRAGVEKLVDPRWATGDALLGFFQAQLSTNAVYFPFYQRLITQLFAPHAFVLGWIISIGELLVGIAILAGTLTTSALLAGLFMNLNFVLAGVVSPSAFYIVIQATLLVANIGTTLGGDGVLARFFPATTSSSDLGNRAFGKWLLVLSGVMCTIIATLDVPYIRDFGPHSVGDPAMLLFILSMLGAMLAGIHYVRLVTSETRALQEVAVLSGTSKLLKQNRENFYE